MDRRSLLDDPPQPAPSPALKTSIIDWFEPIADRYADRFAIRDRTHCLTYAELAHASDRITSALRAERAGTGPIAMLLGIEARDAPAILGVLSAVRAWGAMRTIRVALEIGRRFEVTVPDSTAAATGALAEWANDIARRTQSASTSHSSQLCVTTCV